MDTVTVPIPRSVIIPMLSKRLYSSLASAMREVVSNSSDADADRVDIIFFKAPTESGEEYHLTFTDDGLGMSFDPNDLQHSDFVNYLTIGGLSRRDREGTTQTPRGRPLIGFMGVGSLAVAPWCDYITVLTKQKGNKQALFARVDYRKFFENRAVQKSEITSEYSFQWELIDVPEEDIDKSWTIIDMVGVREEISETLSQPIGQGGLGLFNKGFSQFTGSTPRSGRRSFDSYSGLSKFMHDLALMIPLRYPDGAPLNDPPRKVLAETVKAAVPEVWMQGVEMHRPMWILGHGLARYDSKTNAAGDYGVETIAENLPSGIPVQGYIYWQSGQLFFAELTGVQIRVNHVGIGKFDPTWLNYRGTSSAIRDKQICGELSIVYSDALHDALKSDREGFDEDSKIYKELQVCVHTHLSKVLKTITRASANRSRARNGAQETTSKSYTVKLPPTAPPQWKPPTSQGTLSLDVPTPLLTDYNEASTSPSVTHVDNDLESQEEPTQDINLSDNRYDRFDILLDTTDDLGVQLKDFCTASGDDEGRVQN